MSTILRFRSKKNKLIFHWEIILCITIVVIKRKCTQTHMQESANLEHLMIQQEKSKTKLNFKADNEVKDEKGNLITKPFKCFSLFFSCLISLFKCIRNDVRGMQQRSLSIYTRKKNTHPPFFLLSFEKWSSFFH